MIKRRDRQTDRDGEKVERYRDRGQTDRRQKTDRQTDRQTDRLRDTETEERRTEKRAKCEAHIVSSLSLKSLQEN